MNSENLELFLNQCDIYRLDRKFNKNPGGRYSTKGAIEA